MSISVIEETTPQTRTKPSVVEAYYTICPVFNASNVAVELGWLDEEFKRVNARPVYLRSLAENAGWLPHYNHSLHPLFRDGGAIPTIQVRADLENTKLIGLTWARSGGQILVRADSELYRGADLRGRKIGLFKSGNTRKIDFARATAERGILQALALSGLKRADVEIVDLLEEDDPHFLKPAARPSELWAQLRGERDLSGGKDIAALRAGTIDAIFVNPGRSHELLKNGEFKIIEDLSLHPDWTLQTANGPYTAAVSADFAESHRDVVVAFLRASIRAGRWINEHRDAAAEIFHRVTFHRDVAQISRTIAGIDFVPSLSPLNLAALTLQKNFLREHGYVRGDFDVKDWADDSFLKEALAGL